MKIITKNKLLAVVISAFLALFCVLGATLFKPDTTVVKAEKTTPTLTIQSKNLSYADSLYILYAVSNEGFDRQENDIQMLFWTETQTEYVLGTEAYAATNRGNATVKGADCLVFYSNGLAAKQMTDDIYARACVTIDGVEYYSETVKYSVLEYVYEMREKGTLSETKEALFDAILEYGAAAQKVFNYKTNRLANATYYKISVENGVLQDGFTTGRYQANDVVTLTANAPEEGYNFSHWVDSADNKISTEMQAQITVNGNNTYTAEYAAVSVGLQGLAYTLSDDGTYYIVKGIGTYTDTKVVIPETYEGLPVTSIGSSAFRECSSLTSVAIGNGVTSIGGGAFYGCSSLTSVVIGNGVTSIGSSAFSGCSSLTEINISDSVTSIGYYAFEGCSSLTKIDIPDSVKSIGERAFFGCSGLTEIVIPDSVTWVGSSAFSGCSSLTELVIPDSVTSIGSSVFSRCSGLTEIVIPDSVTWVGNSAFSGCSGLTSVTIGKGVTSIGESAFWGCDSLNSITIPFVGNKKSGSDHGHFGYIFGGSDYLNNSYVPSSLKTVIITGDGFIANYAFRDCSNLTSVSIGDMHIAYSAFERCSSLTEIIVGENNAYHSSLDGNLYNKDQTTLIQYTVGKKDNLFAIPDSVTSINDGAFGGCDSLTEIVIPDSVTSIGNSAFSGCDGLTEIIIPDSVTSIGYSAFSGTGYSKNESNWENGVLYIDKWLIDANRKSTGVYTIKDGTLRIADRAFYHCLDLTKIVIPNSVTSIGVESFNTCQRLREIIIPDGITSIGEDAFYNTEYSNNESNWENGVLYIGKYLIEAKEDIVGAYIIKDGTLCIADYAFEYCSSLTSVTIGKGVRSIGIGVFNGCSSLTSVTFEGTVAQWNAIGKGGYWNYDVPATEVICSNGVVSI